MQVGMIYAEKACYGTHGAMHGLQFLQSLSKHHSPNHRASQSFASRATQSGV